MLMALVPSQCSHAVIVHSTNTLNLRSHSGASPSSPWLIVWSLHGLTYDLRTAQCLVCIDRNRLFDSLPSVLHLVLTLLRGLAVVFPWKCTGFQDELQASSYTCDGFPQRCVTAFSTCKRLSRHSPFAYPWTAFTTPVPYRHFVHLPIFPSTAELSSVRLQPSFNFPQIERCYDDVCDSQCGTRYASPCSKSSGIVVEISTGQDKALT